MNCASSISSEAVCKCGLGFALDRNEIDLDQFRIVEPRSRLLADDQIYAVDLAQALQARRNIHRISEQRIVDMFLSAEIPDDTFTRVDPGAHLDGLERSAGRQRLAFPAAVQASQCAAHRLGCPNRVLACSGSTSGVFQNAMMQLPMYLSILPFCSVMISVIGDRKLFMNFVNVLASMPSARLVNPRMSQNMMVIVRVSPSRTSFSGCAASSCT